MTSKLDLSALIRFQRLRQRASSRAGTAPSGDGRLVEITGFGSNPGELRMLAYVPPGLPQGAPLVVALHGCTQTAGGYDLGCGWSDMADRCGFALLMPEQRRSNNAHLCFNWFEPGDTRRGAGEALSIQQMVARMVQDDGLDPARVFISGLSAGGAMTAVMLATYPEVFAGGALVAGLPYGVAHGVGEALKAMSRPGNLTGKLRGDAVRAASRHSGPWPRVAVWHGDADSTVHPDNAQESVKQWLDLHGLAGVAPQQSRGAAGHSITRWARNDGQVQVALHRVPGLGHGVPLAPGREAGCCGRAGPYLLDVGLSSTHAILEFWGLEAEGPALPDMEVIPPGAPEPPRQATPAGTRDWSDLVSAEGPGAVITKALRAAGLMKG
ncbi:extracellular catalytic domain type 1 short-chain-length polyhydroxyalkanoate depolymerase [Pseudoroseomonas ludipueritiae]|uniref:PHB depolymerase family esterase n=1 Tax=Pseudoroseomonas ludipueritiae TaxID=198093 RepID=A0ABR7R1X5_9PROT|nr:PHB depolymerase family esterase [Pseudoroseomonas ludipueritiae]MBC9175648.1 PHB depolymerase family esterase [Pseudoroseomonas ludipueritiae]